jgi:hypothetical protein
MRNHIAYTSTLPSVDGMIAINLSLLISERYTSSSSEFLLDPFTELSKTIRSQIPQGCTRLFLTNLGILVEPELKLTPSRLLLDLAVDYDVILQWDGTIVDGRKLLWNQNGLTRAIEFPENTLHKMEKNV